MLKFTGKNERLHNPTALRRKSNAGDVTIPDLKLYLGAILTKSYVTCTDTDRRLEGGMKDPGRKQHSDGHLRFDTVL